MHILVIDGSHVEAEFRAKFGPAHAYSFINTEDSYDWEAVEAAIDTIAATVDVSFTFALASDTHGATRWFDKFSIPAFAEISWNSLAQSHFEATNGKPKRPCFGFCGLPTLLNRPLLEVSLYDEADREQLAAICAALGTDYRLVADRVGLVTPRVICQIINEACFTVQEGTATMQDVDLGMRLGTNYPRGPFAWANAIGVERVYAVLDAMWHDTHDERYKICPLLKRQALRGAPFAV